MSLAGRSDSVVHPVAPDFRFAEVLVLLTQSGSPDNSSRVSARVGWTDPVAASGHRSIRRLKMSTAGGEKQRPIPLCASEISFVRDGRCGEYSAHAFTAAAASYLHRRGRSIGLAKRLDGFAQLVGRGRKQSRCDRYQGLELWPVAPVEQFLELDPQLPEPSSD